jgi:hypothetical protein
MSWALGYVMDPERMKEYAIEHELPVDVSRFSDLFKAVLAEWSRKSGYPPHWELCIVGGESAPVFVLYLINPESVDDFKITAHKLGPRENLTALLQALKRPLWYYVEIDDYDPWAEFPSDLYDDELVRVVDEHMGTSCRVHRVSHVN